MVLAIDRTSQAAINERMAQLGEALIETGRVKNQSRLADSLGTSQNQINKILNREKGKNVTPEMMARVLQVFPEVNPVWWMGLDDGPMFSEGNARGLGPLTETDYVDLPFVKADLRASFAESILNNEPIEIEKIRVLYVNPKQYAKGIVLEVNGDSMEPNYVPGARVLATPVDPGDWEFMNSGVYAVAFGNSFVIKRVKDNDIPSKGMLTLHSDNPQGGSLPVAVKHIRAVWKIEQIVYSPAR